MIIGSAFSYVILGIVCALAILGTTLKIFFWRRPGWFSTGLYHVMGWLSLALVWGMIPAVPGVTLGLIAIGGALYTSEVIFYQTDKQKF